MTTIVTNAATVLNSNLTPREQMDALVGYVDTEVFTLIAAKRPDWFTKYTVKVTDTYNGPWGTEEIDNGRTVEGSKADDVLKTFNTDMVKYGRERALAVVKRVIR